jgi:hypothetical protein
MEFLPICDVERFMCGWTAEFGQLHRVVYGVGALLSVLFGMYNYFPKTFLRAVTVFSFMFDIGYPSLSAWRRNLPVYGIRYNGRSLRPIDLD